MEDGTGTWNLLHATVAGNVSLATYEGLHSLTSGPVVAALYMTVTIVTFTLIHWHRRVLKAAK
jgi:hypothetical protein